MNLFYLKFLITICRRRCGNMIFSKEIEEKILNEGISGLSYLKEILSNQRKYNHVFMFEDFPKEKIEEFLNIDITEESFSNDYKKRRSSDELNCAIKKAKEIQREIFKLLENNKVYKNNKRDFNCQIFTYDLKNIDVGDNEEVKVEIIKEGSTVEIVTGSSGKKDKFPGLEKSGHKTIKILEVIYGKKFGIKIDIDSIFNAELSISGSSATLSILMSSVYELFKNNDIFSHKLIEEYENIAFLADFEDDNKTLKQVNSIKAKLDAAIYKDFKKTVVAKKNYEEANNYKQNILNKKREDLTDFEEKYLDRFRYLEIEAYDNIEELLELYQVSSSDYQLMILREKSRQVYEREKSGYSTMA